MIDISVVIDILVNSVSCLKLIINGRISKTHSDRSTVAVRIISKYLLTGRVTGDGLVVVQVNSFITEAVDSPHRLSQLETADILPIGSRDSFLHRILIGHIQN